MGVSNLAHDVFISHSQIDKCVADAVCSMLEQNKIRCWIAPRDVTPGRNYAACITEAIKLSRIMVIIFSNNSNTSGPVTNELEIATKYGTIIIPFRIEDITPSDEMEYYLSSKHWLDAITPPIEQHILKLVDIIKTFIQSPDLRKNNNLEHSNIKNLNVEKYNNDCIQNDTYKGNIKLVNNMKKIEGEEGKVGNKIPLHFIFIIDCSGSMSGAKINALNHTMSSLLPAIKEEFTKDKNTELLMRIIAFSSGAKWVLPSFKSISEFNWTDLIAEGTTDLGEAFQLVIEEFKPNTERQYFLPPILVLITDGQPTDDYKRSLSELLASPTGKNAIKLSIAIGRDADIEVIREFISNPEIPILQANNPEMMMNYIKWTFIVAKQVVVQSGNDVSDYIKNFTMSIPETTDYDEVW